MNECITLDKKTVKQQSLCVPLAVQTVIWSGLPQIHVQLKVSKKKWKQHNNNVQVKYYSVQDTPLYMICA